MKLISLKCRICDAWYNPAAHHQHCPFCATLSVVIDRQNYTVYGRAIDRAIPRLNLNTKRALQMARELYSR